MASQRVSGVGDLRGCRCGLRVDWIAGAGADAFRHQAGPNDCTPAAVEYLYPEQVTVAAGKASEVTLHFRIAQGLHINSHMPRENVSYSDYVLDS